MARDDVHAPAGPTKKGTRRRDGVPRPCDLSLSTSVSSWDTLAGGRQHMHALFHAVALAVTGDNPRAQLGNEGRIVGDEVVFGVRPLTV